MTATWIPIATALIAIVGGAVAYWNQRRIDRNADLISKRREAYEEYLKAYLYTDSKGRLERLNYARMTVALIASDRVLSAIAKLDDYSISTSEVGQSRDMEKFSGLMTEVVGAMRRDVFEKTKLSNAELRRALPIR